MLNPSLPLLRPAWLKACPDVVAGFSTRQGGVSRPPFTTLNLGLNTGDRWTDVLENRRRLFEAFGFSPEEAAIPHQVHGNRVEVVEQPGEVAACDGLVTSTPGLLLCIGAADCAVVLLADPARRVVGACHAGWRGTVKQVAAETIHTMQHLGAVSSNIRAYIGPCISVRHFEVGPEVATQFDAAFVHQEPGWRRPHVDLKSALTQQLQAVGLRPEHIEVASACTFAQRDHFYSYRAEAGETGRMMGCIALHRTP